MICRICGNTEDNRTYDVREMMFGTRETFAYFQCAKCGCLQIADIPTDMSPHYPDDYYSFNLSPERLFANPLKNLFKRPRDRYAVLNEGLFGRLLYAVFPNANLRKLRLAKVTEDTRILEVGCGTGTLLYTLRNCGIRNTLGVDAYIEKDIRYDNGLEILKQAIDEVTGAWDMVMFNHSLEHMGDQSATLSAAAGLLTEGGVCFIRTPTVSSYAWGHYGVNWVQLDAPRHFYLHSVGSLRLLAEKAGLRVDEVVYDSDGFQFWGSEQYAKDIPLKSDRSYSENPRGSPFSAAEIKAFERRARALNGERPQ